MKNLFIFIAFITLLPLWGMSQHNGGIGRGDFSLTYADPVILTATEGTPGPASYGSLTEAFDAINLGTHRGDITIELTGSTTETASAVLYKSGPGDAKILGGGTSYYTSVLIYPASPGISISGNIAGPLVDLDGAANVIIDGRVGHTGATADLVISNSSTSATAGTSTIRFINDANSNTVNYCTLKGASTAGDATPGGIVLFSTTGDINGNDGNTISDNNFTNAGGRPCKAIFSLGTDAAANSSNSISDNNFYDFMNLSTSSAAYGIYIASMRLLFLRQDSAPIFTGYSSTIAPAIILLSATTISAEVCQIAGAVLFPKQTHSTILFVPSG